MDIKLFILSLPLFFLSCSANSQAEKQKHEEKLLDTSYSFDSFKLDSASTFSWAEQKGNIDSTVSIEGNGALKLPEGISHIKLGVKGILPKKIYKFSYWTKNKTVLKIITTKDKKHITLWATREIAEKDGWKQLECLVHLPMLDNETKVEMVIWKPKNSVSWVDNLHIKQLAKVETEDVIKFKIKGDDFEKFQTYREKAAHKAIIASENKKWTNGSLNGTKTKLKLKGDRTDHIKEGIWSRKLKSKEELLPGLKSFNIQSPLVRNFHKEWIFFELCKEHGLATPFYDFSYVSFNGSDPVYCALEDNFGNNFVDRKIGYKAPVLRFYEDHIFPYFVYSWGNPDAHSEHFKTSHIYCFEEEKYAGEKRKEFDKAASAMRALVTGNNKTADYDKWATLFAITSLTKSFHGLAWHNQRFFLNENDKIEPIPYDGNTPKGDAESWSRGKAILGDFRGYTEYPENPMYFFQLNLMQDSVFRALYTKKLKEISKNEYLKAFVAKRQDKLNEIYRGASNFYEFDTTMNYLFNNAKKIEESVEDFSNIPQSLFKEFFSYKERDYKPSNIPLKPEGLQAFITAVKDGDKVKVINGTGIDVLIQYGELKSKLINNTVLGIDYNKDSKKIKVTQKSDSTITFDIEVIDWVPTVK